MNVNGREGGMDMRWERLPTRTGARWVLAVGLLAAALVSLLRVELISVFATTLSSLAAIALITVGVRAHRPVRPEFWWLVRAAFVTGVVAVVVGVVLRPGPSATAVLDLLLLVNYLLFVAAVLVVMPLRDGGRDWVGILDTLTLVVAGGAVIWYFVAEPELRGGVTFHSAMVGIAYPLLDVVLLVVLAQLWFVVQRRGFTLSMVMLAVGGSVAADVASALQAGDQGYRLGTPTDGLWLLAAVGLAAAALDPGMRRFAARGEDGDGLARISAARTFLVGAGAFGVLVVLTGLAYTQGRLEETAPALVVAMAVMTMVTFARSAVMVGIVHRAAEGYRSLNEDLGGALAEQERLHKRVSHVALHDELTGLANRRLFQKTLARLGGGDGPLAVVFVDIDDFKDINDTMGHDAGDLALQSVARRLQRVVRPDDVVARLGGDEFAILLHRVGSSDLADIGRRLAVAIEPATEILDREVQITVSAGVAWSDGQGDRGDLLRCADIAMYEAKRRGKNRFVVFEPWMQESRVATAERHLGAG